MNVSAADAAFLDEVALRLEMEAIAERLSADLRREAWADSLRMDRVDDIAKNRRRPDLKDGALGVHVYALVDDDEVPTDTQTLAFKALAYATADLGLPCVPRLRWMVAESDEERAYVAARGARDWPTITFPHAVRGLCARRDDPAKSIVWLNAIASPVQLIRTVLHEARHAAQGRSTRPAEELETDAHAYAADRLGRCLLFVVRT